MNIDEKHIEERTSKKNLLERNMEEGTSPQDNSNDELLIDESVEQEESTSPRDKSNDELLSDESIRKASREALNHLHPKTRSTRMCHL